MDFQLLEVSHQLKKLFLVLLHRLLEFDTELNYLFILQIQGN